jgi:hypothetical protein
MVAASLKASKINVFYSGIEGDGTFYDVVDDYSLF